MKYRLPGALCTPMPSTENWKRGTEKKKILYLLLPVNC